MRLRHEGQIERATDPAADEDRLRAAEMAERDVEADVVADHRDLRRRHAEPPLHASPRPRHVTACRPRRRLPETLAMAAVIIAPRLKRLPVGAGVGGDVAGGQERRAGDDGPGSALELVEVDLVDVGDEHRVGVRAVVDRREHAGRSWRYARAASVANGRTVAPGCGSAQVRLRADERREHLLVVRDVEAAVAQLPRRSLAGEQVAAVREERRTGGRTPGSRSSTSRRPGMT